MKPSVSIALLLGVALLMIWLAAFNQRLNRVERQQDQLPAAAGEACRAELDDDEERIRHLEAVRDLAAVAHALAADVEAAHVRLDDIEVELDATAATIPGRERAPARPKRQRPSPTATNLLSERGLPQGTDLWFWG